MWSGAKRALKSVEECFRIVLVAGIFQFSFILNPPATCEKGKEMKRFAILVVLVGILCGCAKVNTPTNTVADSAKESINVIIKEKPECKDVGEVCNSQIDSIVATCNLELDDLNKDVVKWKWSFWGLLVVLGVYVLKRIL